MSAAEVFLAGFQEIMQQPLFNIPNIGTSISIPSFCKESVIDLCQEAIDILKMQPTLVSLSGPLTIVGDLHGNMHDLLRILNKYGLPPITNYLFLGDYVDRGSFSIETMLLLLTYFVKTPANFTLLRGNHEFREVNAVYGFRDEFDSIFYDEDVYDKFNEVFDYLPIAAEIDQTTFCVHGGIASGLNDLSQIYHVPKPITESNIPNLIKKLLWSDPSHEYEGFGETERGFGEGFGHSALGIFMQNSGMKLLIRAHEKQMHGFSTFGKNCMTVFSSSGYFKDNKGAILKFNDYANISVHKFTPVIHPNKKCSSFFKMCNSQSKHDPITYISTFPSFRNVKPASSFKNIPKKMQQPIRPVFSGKLNGKMRFGTMPAISSLPKLKTF